MPKPDTLLVAKRMPNGKLGVVERSTHEGKPRLQPEEKRAQATAMMMRRIFGQGTLEQLGEEFGLAPRTVARRLEGARADGVPDEAREIFIREMLPGAMAVVQEALLSPDIKYALQAAKMVIDGLKVMDPAALQGVLEGSGRTEETLEIYRERIKLSRQPAAPDAGVSTSPAAPAAAGAGAVLEGTVVSRPADAPSALPPADPAGADQGPDFAGVSADKGE